MASSLVVRALDRSEMRKAVKVLLLILAVLAISAIVGWVAGPAAAGTALLMISIGLGAYFGGVWGGNHATQVERYRQELIGKKRRGSQPSTVLPKPDDQDQDSPER